MSNNMVVCEWIKQMRGNGPFITSRFRFYTYRSGARSAQASPHSPSAARGFPRVSRRQPRQSPSGVILRAMEWSRRPYLVFCACASAQASRERRSSLSQPKWLTKGRIMTIIVLNKVELGLVLKDRVDTPFRKGYKEYLLSHIKKMEKGELAEKQGA